MGASGWHYAVPYQADVNAALQHLRLEVFKADDYYREDIDERFAPPVDREPTLADLDDLLFSQPDSGTHSIIDIDQDVTETPESGTVSPLTTDQSREAFGTTRPTAAQVEAWAGQGGYTSYRSCYEGVYIVSYGTDGNPDQIHFTGYSGD